jgi:hypothetical protein
LRAHKLPLRDSFRARKRVGRATLVGAVPVTAR